MVNRVNGVSTIANGLIINGNITGDGDMNIAGCVEGEVLIKNGTMTIEQTGYVEGKLVVMEVSVAGEVRGNIEASSKITIKPSGKVICDVKTARIDIAEGAFLSGNFVVEDKSGTETGK
ncbi:polymer-forming cytoskeletal protein [bacterium]|nr:polymer-forming cytoskeletal protein [candidate division CSSED10-310 bacterium]